MIHYAGAAMSAHIARDLSAFSRGPGPVAEGAASSGPIPSLSFSAALEDGPTEAVQVSGSFVVNDESRAIHWLPKDSPKTRCGWLLTTTPTTILCNTPLAEAWHRVCDRCLPELRERLFTEDLQVELSDSE